MTVDETERLSRALDKCSQRVQRGEPLDRCLLDYPAAYREELARLVPLGARLHRLAHDPAPAFQARLEQRLREAEDAVVARPRARWPGRLFAAPWRRAAALVLMAMLVLGGTGMGVVQASADSLPDSPLYQVKTAREAAEVLLARNPEAKTGAWLRQLAQRGRELELAVRLDKPPRVVELLAGRFLGSTQSLVEQSLALRARGNPQPAAQALALFDAMEARVRRLLPTASPAARPVLVRLLLELSAQKQHLR